LFGDVFEAAFPSREHGIYRSGEILHKFEGGGHGFVAA